MNQPPGLIEMGPTMPDAGILREAEQLVCSDRRGDYGGVRENFSLIAQLWTALLDHEVTMEDVVRCMIAVKLARDVTGKPKRDTVVDMAGYACLLNSVRPDEVVP